MAEPVLTVITVVYNDVRHIERTMLSVLRQDYPRLEYIVVDGRSTDGTLDIILRYAPRLGKLISEKDAGIYDAMNKGLDAATGDFILFMNSGDEFYADDTASNVMQAAEGADVCYGETEMIDESGRSLGRRRHRAPERLSWRSFRYGMSVSHQAIYVRRSLAGHFSDSYALSADIDWILQILRRSKRVVNVHRYVARYLVGGMSKKRHWESLKERYGIMRRHYGMLPTLFYHAVIALRLAAYWIRHRRTND